MLRRGAAVLTLTGQAVIAACREAGRAVRLLGRTMSYLPQVGHSLRILLRQLDAAGFGSILVLCLISGLTGMIMAMQMGAVLVTYGALDTMGMIIALTFCRELGPIWAAVIVLARVGSSMAAELGTMVVNEEVEALRVMNIDPVRYLVLPRVVALTIAMPLLTAIGDLVGISGGALVSHTLFGLPTETYWEGAAQVLDGFEFYSGLFKGMIFGVIIGTIACDQGLNAAGGAEGVGSATTRSVMLNVVFVLVGDFILTALYRIFDVGSWF